MLVGLVDSLVSFRPSKPRLAPSLAQPDSVSIETGLARTIKATSLKLRAAKPPQLKPRTPNLVARLYSMLVCHLEVAQSLGVSPRLTWYTQHA